MFDFVRYFLGFAVWIFVLVVAVWRGQWSERVVGWTMLIGMILTPIVQTRAFSDHPDWGIMLVDTLVTLIIIAVSMKTTRWWPLFCAAYHVLSVGIHVIKITRPDASQFAYLTAAVVFSYLGLLALAVGVVGLELQRWRERRLLAVQG